MFRKIVGFLHSAVGPEASLTVRLAPGLGNITATGATISQVLPCPEYTLVELEYALAAQQTRQITVSGSPAVLEAPVLWLETGGGVVNLHWEAVIGAASYRVERRDPMLGGWCDVSGSGEFTGTGWRQSLSAGVSVYRVIAVQ